MLFVGVFFSILGTVVSIFIFITIYVNIQFGGKLVIVQRNNINTIFARISFYQLFVFKIILKIIGQNKSSKKK